MEAPVILFNKPTPIIEDKNLINTEVSINGEKFVFNIIIDKEDKILFNLVNQDYSSFAEYKKELTIDNFRNLNKYFKIFDTLDELGNELINLINENSFNFSYKSNEIMSLNLRICLKTINIVTINLEKCEIKHKEKINKLIDLFNDIKRNLEIKDEKISELENKISLINSYNDNFKKNILEELNKKDQKIKRLEQDLYELKNIVNNLREEKTKKKEKTSNICSINIFENILKNSSIFQDSDEILFLLNNIPNSQYNIKLLYNSKNEKEDEEKLLNSYTDKTDIIILVKTDKLRRFGGYVHESFKKEKFKQCDKNAFLFNLNKKTIYKSKGNERTIWRGFNTKDSINFGNGVDLKIFHHFTKKQSKTHQGNNDYDYQNEDYALNGEESFNISSLEIYQVLLIQNK